MSCNFRTAYLIGFNPGRPTVTSRLPDRFSAQPVTLVVTAGTETFTNHVDLVLVQGGAEFRAINTDPGIVLTTVAMRDLNGNLLADKMVGHVFRIENGLIKRFDIQSA